MAMRETMDNRGEMEIDLVKLLWVYLRKWWLILISCVVCAGVALLYTRYCVTPIYRTSVTIYVNNMSAGERVDSITSANLSTAQQLVNTYVNILRSNSVLERVVEEAQLDYTIDEVRGMMSASQVDETEMFNVYIDHPDPEQAAYIANAIADVAPSEIESIVEGSSTRIIDYARVPDSRYSPSYSRNTLMGGLLGGVLAVGIVTLRYLLDVRIKDEEELAQLLDLPVLGRIPSYSQRNGKNSKNSGYQSETPAAPGKSKRR